MNQKVKVIPLAPQALSSPHPYDPDNEGGWVKSIGLKGCTIDSFSSLSVFVQLDEPLWVPSPGAKDIAVEIVSLCVQLDSTFLSNRVKDVVLNAICRPVCSYILSPLVFSMDKMKEVRRWRVQVRRPSSIKSPLRSWWQARLQPS